MFKVQSTDPDPGLRTATALLLITVSINGCYLYITISINGCHILGRIDNLGNGADHRKSVPW